MKTDFTKTDRLIELIEDSCIILSPFNFREAYDLKNSDNPKLSALYKSLVETTQSDKSEEEKQLERIKFYAKSFGKGDDLNAGKDYLKYGFDEELILQRITKSYWQIQSFVTFNNDNNTEFSNLDSDKLMSFINKKYPNELYKNIIAEIIIKNEPRKNDIEREFWKNCKNVSDINGFCNIYRERWSGHLYEFDGKDYNLSSLLFDESNELGRYIKELRLCGLLQSEEGFVESKLRNIALAINMLCESIVELFKKLRASANSTTETKTENNGFDIKTYDIDVNKTNELFTFLKDDGVINCELHEFFKSVATANFSKIYKKKKICLDYMIYAFTKYGGMNEEWYSSAANSIQKDKKQCSGNGSKTTPEYKKNVDAIMSNKFEITEKTTNKHRIKYP